MALDNREKIVVDFDENANITIEVSGVKGSGCKALTDAIEKALGKKTSDVMTGGSGGLEQKQYAKH